MSGERPPSAAEHHLAVTKTARYWTLGDVTAHGGDVWFVLHGYKQLARRFIKRFESIADASRLIVAPEALSRFYVGTEVGRHGPTSVVGATWMTTEDRLNEIDDYVAYLDRLAEALGAEGRTVTVLGFSQGVATATRWVVQGAVRPERLILWGDYWPPDLDMERAARVLSGIDVTLVHGDADPALDARRVEEEGERLRAAEIGHRTVTYPGGHEIDPQTVRSLALV